MNKKRITIFIMLTVGVCFYVASRGLSPSRLSTGNQNEQETKLLKEVVGKLSEINPPRNYSHLDSLNQCADFIATKFKSYGFEVEFQEYQVTGKTYKNVRAFMGNKKLPRIIIGAHYDVAGDNPGADDNASGVAVMIDIAKRLSNSTLENFSVEFVAFTLEEPPFFRTEYMGSNIHAKSLVEDNIKIWGLINLEMVGFYSDEAGSQEYPVPGMSLIYPDKGNFLGVIGNRDNEEMVQTVSEVLKSKSQIEIVSLAAPSILKGIDFSDHLNYWSRDLPAVMITDTAFFRNKHYHTSADTIEKLNFFKMLELSKAIKIGVEEFDSEL